MAMLGSYGAAGDVVFQRLPSGLDIRPFDEFYPDVQYCVLDWHLAALLWSDATYTVPNGPVVTRSDAVAYLSSISAQFWLDGQPIEVTTTPVKVYRDSFLVDIWTQHLAETYGPEASLEHIWAVQWGRPLAPDDLAVGHHTLRVVLTDADSNVAFDNEMDFTVYGSGSPACI
jgi:hypothetical protein